MDMYDRNANHAPHDVREVLQKWLDLAALELTAASAGAHPDEDDADESLFRYATANFTGQRSMTVVDNSAVI